VECVVSLEHPSFSRPVSRELPVTSRPLSCSDSKRGEFSGPRRPDGGNRHRPKFPHRSTVLRSTELRSISQVLRSISQQNMKRRKFQLARPGGQWGPTHHCWWFRILPFCPDEDLVVGGWMIAAASSFLARVVRVRLGIFKNWRLDEGVPTRRQCQLVLSRCPNLSSQCRFVLSHGGPLRLSVEAAYAALCERWLVLLDAITRSFNELCTAESMWPSDRFYGGEVSLLHSHSRHHEAFAAARLYFDGNHFPTAALNATAASFLQVLRSRARGRGRFVVGAPRDQLHTQIAFLSGRIATRLERQRL
jgi:hypothetical protein